MKVQIEINEDLMEEEIIIKCKRMDEKIFKIQSAIVEATAGKRMMALKRQDTEYFVPIEQILFFETENKKVFAHTVDKIFETESKLYELEETLPGIFFRISKSAVVNLNEIYSITKNLTASSLIQFRGSMKQIYVSRNYYKPLVERLAEKRKEL